MNTSVPVDVRSRPEPGWASLAGLVRVSPPGAPAAERDGATTNRLLIAERIARYGWAYDERDQEALAECFTADAVWHGSIMGEVQLESRHGAQGIAAKEAALWPRQGDQRRHLFGNHVIELSGDEATAHAYMFQLRIRDGAAALACSGAYRFRLRREKDGWWRISSLTCALDNLVAA